MEKIGTYLRTNIETAAEKKSGGINSPFNAAIGRVCDFMRDKRFKYWCGRLKRFSPQQIDAMISIAKNDGKKPAAYFNFLIKKRLEEAKKLSTELSNTTPLQLKPPGV